MKVSHSLDHASNVIVGQKESVSMGIADSAALMHILSSTLYSYPKVAAVREILCNAWDAHISAGKTDVPVTVTIKDSTISIRDYGYGISHILIGPTYGIYGGSDKTGDTTLTGGFGLGCKAPLAVVDNFQVISIHKGIKTIYRITKSIHENDGKPSIVTLYQEDSDEPSGIEVSFTFNDTETLYENISKEIADFGGIFAQINGVTFGNEIPILENKTGYVVTNRSHDSSRPFSPINVRYGNVIYPVENQPELGTEWSKVNKALELCYSNSRVIFNIPPDSISIAPSRESIIYTPKTLKLIKEALSSFEIFKYTPTELQNRTTITALEKTTHLLRQCLKKTPITCSDDFNKEVITLTDEGFIAEESHGFFNSLTQAQTMRKISRQIGSHFCYRATALNVFERLKAANKNSAFPNQRLYRSLLSTLADQKNHQNGYLYPHLFKDDVFKYGVSRLYKHLSKEELSNLSFGNSPNKYRIKPVPINREGCCLDVGIALLFPRVIIVSTIAAYNQYLDKTLRLGVHFVYKMRFGAQEQINQMVSKFTTMGFKVEVYKPEKVIRHASPVATKKQFPKDKYVTLIQAHEYARSAFSFREARNNVADSDLIKNPIAYMTIQNNSSTFSFYYGKDGILDNGSLFQIKNLFKNQIALITPTQEKDLIAKGIPELSQFIKTHVIEHLYKNPEVKHYAVFAQQGTAEKITYEHREVGRLIVAISKHPELLKKLRIPHTVSPKTYSLILLFLSLDFHSKYAITKTNDPKVLSITKVLNSKPSKKFKALFDSLIAFDAPQYINIGVLSEILRRQTPSENNLALASAYKLIVALSKG